MSAMLELEGISKRFGGVRAVEEVSFAVPERAIVSVIGPNGAGKTTMFNLISGVTRPDSGRVTYRGGDITGRPAHLVARLGIARTFQNIHLFKGRTVLDNVRTACHIGASYGILPALARTAGMRRQEDQLTARSHELLQVVGLDERCGDKADSLPYGHQRKLEIAKALAVDPKLLLLDEPAAGLNPEETRALTGLVRSIATSFELTVLLIEHHMDVVMDISDRVVVLEFGRKICEGSPAEVQCDPRVIKAYLGEEVDDA